jgi:hypothetical protein
VRVKIKKKFLCHLFLHRSAPTLLQGPDALEHEPSRRRQDVRLLELPAVEHDRRLGVDAVINFEEPLLSLFLGYLGVDVA